MKVEWRGGIWSTDSVTDSRAGTDVRFGRGRVHAGGRMVSGAGIWSTDSVANSRTGTDVRFGRGSPRGREGGQWRGGFGQRTLSRTRGRGWMSALGEGAKEFEPLSTQRARRFFFFLASFAPFAVEGTSEDLVNGPLRVADSRTGTDVRFGRESPRVREAGQWRGGFG